MKITKKILKHRAKQALETAKYLDISGLGIGAIEGLEACRHLQVLDLSHNNIEEVEGINYCRHLWNINLSHNQISSLTQITNFYAFGTVDLSFNKLLWQELSRIRDVVILDLHLHGNPHLEKDPYYRIHVIDCLPNIWMLDGRIITSAERNQAQNFFYDSALSSHPVRRKLPEKPRSSNARQRLHVESIHGIRTSILVTKFARNEIHSAGTDLRRLSFLFENLQADLEAIPHSLSMTIPFPENYFHAIIQERLNDRERCNVLLLLLLASLEFSLPSELLLESLQITKLDSYANVDTSLLFTMDRHLRIRLASLLLSASKLDRDMSIEGSGGLYDRLYLCLYYLVSDLVKSDWKNWKRRSSAASEKAKLYLSSYLRPNTAPTFNLTDALYAKKMDQSKEEHRMLLASEVVLLLNVVPTFYKYIENDPSMRSLLQTATNDATLTSKIIEISKEAREQGGDMQNLCQEISDCSVQQIERATIGIRFAAISQYLFSSPNNKFLPTNDTRSEWKIILNTKNSYSRRPKSAVLTSGELLTSGRQRTYSDMQKGFHIKAAPLVTSNKEAKITLGSQILLGPQNMARVIAMPEQNIVLVQMSSVPAPNGSVIIQSRNEDDHYCYVDVKKLVYDKVINCWKPKGTVGDRITLQISDGSDKNDMNLSRTPDALIYDRDSNKSPRPIESHRQSVTFSSTNITPRTVTGQNIPIDKFAIDLEDFDLLDSVRDIHSSQTPRPLSALYKEKMNLRLPIICHDASTDTKNQADKDIQLVQTPHSDVLEKSSLVAGNIDDMETDSTVLNGQENQTTPNTALSHLTKTFQEETSEPPLAETTAIAETSINEGENPDNPEEDLTNIDLTNAENEQEPELQALIDEDQNESPPNTGVKHNTTSERRRRATSARRPKNPKVTESNRPVSAVLRLRDLKGPASKLYGDEFDRPESASSFQLERTEAWRSSASSSMNITFDPTSSKKAAIGFMSVPVEKRQTTFQVIALRPTPPQRPSSPSHQTGQKNQTLEKSNKKTPVIMNSSKDTGIKLASNWLADGKDLHEEYKKSRIYMSPRLPGYLDGIINQKHQREKSSTALPLTASFTVKQDRLSSVRSNRRATPVNMLKDYLPPGIGVPESEYRTRFSPLEDVKKLSGRYPTVTLLRPQQK